VKRVDYRYFKTFVSGYTGRDGISKERSYKLYVRDLERGVLTDVNPAGDLLWQHGLYKGDKPKSGSGLRVVRSRQMFEFVESLIEQGLALGKLYSLEGKK
ncbi:MAG: hypothetical protein KGM99_17515, partial [Burkholderiales bacterium]|nr:hypothetical protein [Burkholderiales bacterium]